ncbi:MAG: hypothetical protein HY270_24585, partial [Deltaproteobacteria bacterium]|nr:hypothetical protein [Deltaproteobacteria bacterium]
LRHLRDAAAAKAEQWADVVKIGRTHLEDATPITVGQEWSAYAGALDDTIAYVKDRRAFGKSIASFQNTQFKLAELETEVEIGQAFVDKLLTAHVRGDDVVKEVSMAKWWSTDLQKRLTGECVQLHGGYGFMNEYPIATDYADAAVQSIYAGTNEIMKVIIARRMGLE